MTRTFDIPYKPRPHFVPVHASTKRWKFVCAHRRAGKTVAHANNLIRAAVLNDRKWPVPRYAYIGPSFDQAKDLVWEYLKQYTQPIDGMEYMEGELKVIFPNRASIKLYGGSAAYQRMRGMYFDGAVLDEFPLLEPTVLSTVVRPCLADYSGWAIVSGTSNGDDHFGQLKLKAELDPRWDVFIIPLSQTHENALSHAEAKELTQDMSPEEYAREMECFPRGTLIATSRGHVPIERLRPSDSVLTHRGRWRPVTEVLVKTFKGEMVEITAFGSSKPLLVTPEHPIRVYLKETNTSVWRKACELKVDDCLLLPTPRSSAPMIAEDLAFIIAWYITEGSVNQNCVTFSLNPKNSSERYKLQAALQRAEYQSTANADGRIVVSSVALADRLVAWCGSLAQNKHIPFDVIGGLEELVFKELMLGDGCLSQPVQGGHCWIYTTISRALAFDVQLLAAMLGRRVGITERPPGDMISPNNGEIYPSAPSFQVRIPYGTSVNHSKARDAWPTANGIAYRIKAIDRVNGDLQVFNLSVKEDESYVAEGRAVHNCSFEAPIEGSYYGDQINQLGLQKRIASVPPDLAALAITAWDLGISDHTAIWIYQVCGREIHVIDYLEGTGKGLDFYAAEIIRRGKAGGYQFKAHCLPHDVEARELSTGQSRRQTLSTLLPEPTIVAPLASIEDGITAVRGILGMSWFDAVMTKRGVASLRGYHRNKSGKPAHDHYSHGADAFRTLATSYHLAQGLSSSFGLGQRLRRRIRGLI